MNGNVIAIIETFINFPISEVKVPRNSLSCISNSLRFVISPILGGILPLKALPLMCRVSNVAPPKMGGLPSK